MLTPVSDQRLDGGDVAAEARHDVAELAAFEEAQATVAAGARTARPAGSGRTVRRPRRSGTRRSRSPRPATTVMPRYSAATSGEEPEVVRREHVVDEHLVEVDARRGERGNGAGEQQAQHHPAAEIAGVGPEPRGTWRGAGPGGLLDEAVVLVVRSSSCGAGSATGGARRCAVASSFSSSSSCGKPRRPDVSGGASRGLLLSGSALLLGPAVVLHVLRLGRLLAVVVVPLCRACGGTSSCGASVGSSLWRRGHGDSAIILRLSLSFRRRPLWRRTSCISLAAPDSFHGFSAFIPAEQWITRSASEESGA